jgi:benzoyl-CoA reductase/2-hydroxyglutaryl-CoA dehydratase subunit BcrC/BadD/HgdB
MTAVSNTIGYFCSLVPVEMIMAAGLKPLRVKGKAETTAAADAYLYPNMCPYIKSLFTDALDGGDAAREGVVFTRSCDGMRRLYDAWQAYVPGGFAYMLQAPKNCDSPAVSASLHNCVFAQKLGQRSGVCHDSARHAVKSVNHLVHDAGAACRKYHSAGQGAHCLSSAWRRSRGRGRIPRPG